MATMITTECILCGMCETECPNQAIREGEDGFAINPNLCTECVGFHGVEACQEACPVDCCVPDDNFRESEEDLLARAVKIHGQDEIPKLEDLDETTSRFRNKEWNNESEEEDPQYAEDWTPLWDD